MRCSAASARRRATRTTRRTPTPRPPSAATPKVIKHESGGAAVAAVTLVFPMIACLRRCCRNRALSCTRMFVIFLAFDLRIVTAATSPTKLENGHAANGTATRSAANGAANGTESRSPSEDSLSLTDTSAPAPPPGYSSPPPRQPSPPPRGHKRRNSRDSTSSADSQRVSSGAPAALAWLMGSPRRSPPASLVR